MLMIEVVVTDFERGLLLIDGRGFGDGPLVLLTRPAAEPDTKRGIPLQVAVTALEMPGRLSYLGEFQGSTLNECEPCPYETV